MNPLNLEDITHYVEENIGKFHLQRIESLNKLKLIKVLQRKNPYLFKAKYQENASTIVTALLEAHLSSNEETIFGDWFEGLAIFICERVYGGRKSSTNGLDLEFDREGIRYIVAIKSGPNWGNKSQIQKMLSDFSDAKRTLLTSGSNLSIVCVNGCCYGRCKNFHRFPKTGGDYLKLCGQKFWEFISGDSELYRRIILPLGHKAREQNQDFQKLRGQILNKFTAEFLAQFCSTEGEINWDKILQLNSAESYKLKT